MASRRDNDEERSARIDMILEEFRLNSEDLKQLAKTAKLRVAKMRFENQITRDSIHRLKSSRRKKR